MASAASRSERRRTRRRLRAGRRRARRGTPRRARRAARRSTPRRSRHRRRAAPAPAVGRPLWRRTASSSAFWSSCAARLARFTSGPTSGSTVATCRARQESAPEAGSGAAAGSPARPRRSAPGRPSRPTVGGGLEHDDVDLRDGDRFGVGLARRAGQDRVGVDSSGAAVWPARIRANNESTSASSASARRRSRAPRSAFASRRFAVASGSHDFEHLRLGLRDGDLARDVVRPGRERALGRGARFDMGQRLGRVEERALHHAVRLEQTVAALTKLFDLCLQQAAPAAEIGEHAFARDAALRRASRDPADARSRRSRRLPAPRAHVGRRRTGRSRRGSPPRAPRPRRRSRPRRLRPRRCAPTGSPPPPCGGDAPRPAPLPSRSRSAPRPCGGCRPMPRAPCAAGARFPRRARRAAVARRAGAAPEAAPRGRRGSRPSCCSRSRVAASSSETRRRNVRTSASAYPRNELPNVRLAMSSAERCGVLLMTRCRRSLSGIPNPQRQTRVHSDHRQS